MSAGATSLAAPESGAAARSEAGALAERTLRRVAAAHWIGVAAGAADIFLLLWLVLPWPDLGSARPETIVAYNAVAVAVLAPLGLVLGTWVAYRFATPFTRFLHEGRPPSERDRRDILRHPMISAKIDAVGWGLSAVVVAAINLRFSPDAAFHVGSTVLMGGLTTTAITYLLTERIMRPLTALALAHETPPKLCGPGVQGRLLLAWALATGMPLLGLGFVGLHAVLQGASDRVATSVLVLSGVAIMSGLLATVLVARSVGEPLLALRQALGRIEEGELEVEVPVDDGSEVGLLQSGFNRMVSGLRERERLHDLFGRHVGPDVARQALERPLALGGEQREVAVLFVDLVGSTELATRWAATDVVSLLNRFFTIVVDTVGRHGGWVNKFEGDAALCVFGAPLPDEGCASGALAAARELRGRLSDELPRVDAGIAVSAGLAVAGNVGAEHRFEYTVIGDPVNEAARLCELAKRRPERLLASDAVLERAAGDEAARWRLADAVTLRGRSEPTRMAVPVDGPADRARPAPAVPAATA
jgi:adenylate cyclase